MSRVLMNKAQVSWSKEKQRSLCEHLTDFWAQDVWHMNKSPLTKEIVKRPLIFRFNCQSKPINTEIKYACRQRLIKEEWGLNSGAQIGIQVNRIIMWLQTVNRCWKRA
jgi:hypothetical protein